MQLREKSATYAVSLFIDRELFKILIGSGLKNRPVDAIAGDVLELLVYSNELPNPEELINIPGRGMSSLFTAPLEFPRRHYLTLNTKITHLESIYKLQAHMSLPHLLLIEQQPYESEQQISPSLLGGRSTTREYGASLNLLSDCGLMIMK